MSDIFQRFRHADASAGAEPPRPTVEIDASSLSRVFSAPTWVRDLGLLAWFLVGVAVLLVGLVWLLGLLAIGVLLIVTIGAGALFGMVGLILAAPLTSAAVHISGELASARSKEATAAAEGAPG